MSQSNICKILHVTRELIENEEYIFICNAVLNSAQELRLEDEGDTITDWIREALHTDTFGNWIRENAPHIEDEKKARIQWIDWMITKADLIESDVGHDDWKYLFKEE